MGGGEGEATERCACRHREAPARILTSAVVESGRCSSCGATRQGSNRAGCTGWLTTVPEYADFDADVDDDDDGDDVALHPRWLCREGGPLRRGPLVPQHAVPNSPFAPALTAPKLEPTGTNTGGTMSLPVDVGWPASHSSQGSVATMLKQRATRSCWRRRCLLRGEGEAPGGMTEAEMPTLAQQHPCPPGAGVWCYSGQLLQPRAHARAHTHTHTHTHTHSVPTGNCRT